MKPIRIEFLDDDGEWLPLHDGTDLGFYEKPSLARAVADRLRTVHDAMTVVMHASAKAVRSALDRAGRAFRARRRPNRPARQSPYGPARRRHRP
ncbi:hypothetical protein [Streptomyces sp. NPDC047071]|uniref:hypothetical protein n=1 Tax=Streptomyces sp. NPDC047071 TaxID=3154808 RepID=UPI003456658A